jgi:hypothetical protein
MLVFGIEPTEHEIADREEAELPVCCDNFQVKPAVHAS